MPSDRVKFGAAGVVMVKMSCEHVLVFKTSKIPRCGVLIWCTWCMKYVHRPFPLLRDIDQAPKLDEWRWTCVSGCGTGMRKYGMSGEREAIAAGTRHTVRYPGHEVWVVAPNGIVAQRWGSVGGDGSVLIADRTGGQLVQMTIDDVFDESGSSNDEDEEVPF
jgi:hypothetical protein